MKEFIKRNSNKLKVATFSLIIALLLRLIQFPLRLSRIWLLNIRDSWPDWKVTVLYLLVWVVGLILYIVLYSRISTYWHVFNLGLFPISVFLIAFVLPYKYRFLILGVLYFSFLIIELEVMLEGYTLYSSLVLPECRQIIKNAFRDNFFTCIIVYALLHTGITVIPNSILFMPALEQNEASQEASGSNTSDFFEALIWEANKEMLHELRYDNMKNLDVHERAGLYQAFLNLECFIFDIEKIRLIPTDIAYEDVGGSFDGTSIFIERKYLEDDELLKLNMGLYVILHEVYHYYCFLEDEKELDEYEDSEINMDPLFVKRIQTWKNNQFNYTPSQRLELEAKAYADDYYIRYVEYINNTEDSGVAVPEGFIWK